jgi:hypothetical protein
LHIIGFATKHFTGDDLQENQGRPFKLTWLKQLTELVDFRKLGHGVAHQDIRRQNVLMDSETGSLVLVDFGEAAPFLSPADPSDVGGVVHTLYEIVTHEPRPKEFRDNFESILDSKDWPVKGKLDCEISDVRKHLEDWVKRRKVKTIVALSKGNTVQFPPQLELKDIIEDEGVNDVESGEKEYVQDEDEYYGNQQQLVRWERAPQEEVHQERSKKRNRSQANNSDTSC